MQANVALKLRHLSLYALAEAALAAITVALFFS
jgi:hypothetical protein